MCTREVLSGSLSGLHWECIARNTEVGVASANCICLEGCSRFRGLYMSTNASSPFRLSYTHTPHSFIGSLTLEHWPCFSTDTRAISDVPALRSPHGSFPHPQGLYSSVHKLAFQPIISLTFILPTALRTPVVCHVPHTLHLKL